MWQYNYTDELYHYGVLGMKWGVRRNPKVQAAKKKYKDSKKEYHKAYNKFTRSYFRKNQDDIYEDMRKKAIKTEKDLAEYKKVKKQVKRNMTAKTEKAHEDYNRVHDKKSVKTMSDAELRQRLNRLQMEKQYSKLSNEEVSKGKDFVNKAIKVGTTVATVTSTGITIYNNLNTIKGIGKKITKK